MAEDELGLADFIEILELGSISQYIVKRMRKFSHYKYGNLRNDIDRQYVANLFNNSALSV